MYQLKLQIHDMCCSHMVIPYPHVKCRVQFIITKISMKLVKSVQSHSSLRLILFVIHGLWIGHVFQHTCDNNHESTGIRIPSSIC